jgi:ubiquinone/menaquinone biosynthesis C-methylase UbiE
MSSEPGNSAAPQVIDRQARIGATRQWNALACGELPGDKSTIEYFDRVAEDRYRQQPWQHRYFQFDRFGGKDVLEIGIGQGTDLLQFAKGGATCHGADITDNHLLLTQRNFELRGLGVDLRKSDATALPFADASMDCVYSFGVIHHIPEADQVIAEARRVLKPGGTMMVAFYYRWSAFHLFKKLLLDGIGRGNLFRLGYDGLLATIETGADGKHIKPYVKLYSRAAMRRLFSEFDVQDISVHQLSLDHFLPSSWCGPLVHRQIPLENLMGWYVTCIARRS